MSLRQKVLYQFKEFTYMGMHYPKPHREFMEQLKKMYRAKKYLTKEEDINKALEFGEYMKKELEALYKLRVYREMKRRYY